MLIRAQRRPTTSRVLAAPHVRRLDRARPRRSGGRPSTTSSTTSPRCSRRCARGLARAAHDRRAAEPVVARRRGGHCGAARRPRSRGARRRGPSTTGATCGSTPPRHGLAHPALAAAARECFAAALDALPRLRRRRRHRRRPSPSSSSATSHGPLPGRRPCSTRGPRPARLLPDARRTRDPPARAV